MENLILNCPLCCHKKFTSKQSLIEHLSNLTEHLFCPVCSNKVSSLSQLTEHLRLDNCMPINYVQTIQFEDNTANTPADEYGPDNNIQVDFKPVDHRETSTTEMVADNNFTQTLAMDGDENKMQFDLCLQTQDLKFIKEDGENRFIFLTGDQDALSSEGLVTKQNKDGTISVTLKDIKMDSSSVTPKEIVEEQVVQEYSCSMCKMTFTSVYDHINNYHADQDVVVEGAMPETEDTLAIEYEQGEQEDNNDKQSSRRVITDTGDIVEAPIVVKTFNQMENVEDTPISQAVPNKLKDVPEKQGRGKRYIQIDKLCDSVIRELKPNQKNGPSHKVVIAAPLVMPDGEVYHNKMYHCTSCDMYGNQLADFNSQPCKPAKYACSHCTMVYDNSKSLCAHMKIHKDKTVENVGTVPELYVCEICSTVFLTNKSLKLHKRMHEPVKARPIDPPRTSSSNGARYKCVTCDKLIPTDYREVHNKSHRYDNMLNCTICNKKFTSHEYLEMHMNVHNLDKAPEKKSDKTLPYSCVYCDRKFARPHEKVKHERIHTGEKPHSCEICGKSFRVSYCLTLHMRTHTGARPYACPHCDKRFKAHSVYNHHLLTHSEVRAYKCPFCPKAFKTLVQLAGHKNSHTKPFSCTQCNRPFASLYAVRVHTETHNRQNNLKFRCSLCGASYARAFALKDHIKQVHKQDTDKDPLTGTDDWIYKRATDADKDLGEQEVTEDIITQEPLHTY